VRLLLQAVLDVKNYLTAWWLVAGECVLTGLFMYFTAMFMMAAVAT
jgi:hypothetical protein